MFDQINFDYRLRSILRIQINKIHTMQFSVGEFAGRRGSNGGTGPEACRSVSGAVCQVHARRRFVEAAALPDPPQDQKQPPQGEQLISLS
jgi:hypothetical protein